MPDPTVIFTIVSIFVAGVITGLTSFGFALVTVPLLVIVLPPKVVVPLASLLAGIGGLLIFMEVRPWVDLRRISLLILAGVIAIPFGTYLLLVTPANTLKALIGAVTTLSALAFLLGFSRPIRREQAASVPIGLLSGLLGGSTAMSGPPVILFMSNQGVSKQVFRANINVYFTIIKLWTITNQAAAGLITSDVLSWAALSLPALFIGTLLGMRLTRRVEEAAFRRLTLLVVLATGLTAIASATGLI